ncbi:dihydrofolate reductase family protein [Cohnella nanjingensis]|uniref:Dihydrofolate reductase family protein n=1 Tax=Cohnella nanjingensis TaxID=1387779 RepID=A0A7X0VD33_9BACL|nr:dihydrofolate reductase family protein [Cohnella nanjingensis]MBB6669535.1 dihydrofolate reductase family protein [Cohnella nanjingensis]
MKTILWATLTANGNYAQSGHDNPPKKEALGDFAAHAKATGNFIVGRRTFENMRNASPAPERDAAGSPFGDLDIVVLSKRLREMPGVHVAASPREALDYLSRKGHETALLSGGADLHNAFLEEDLVDEIVFNIAPVLEGKGLNLLLDPNIYSYKGVRLLETKPLGGGVVQLRYAVSQD